MDTKEIKDAIKEKYGTIARTDRKAGQSCCGTVDRSYSQSIGYSEEELKNAPEESNLSLGCGNPTKVADLKEGETVLDLGSGAGLDCFIAASRVGPRGKVIGVDMTPDMIEKARENAKKHNVDNVEFRLGDIENLPVETGTIDVIMSNCVINLSSDKRKAYEEAYRVLKPGGRLAISDIALTEQLPESIRQSIRAIAGCVGGAQLVDDYRKLVEQSGFKGVNVSVKKSSACTAYRSEDPLVKAIKEKLDGGESLIGKVVSVYVEGYR